MLVTLFNISIASLAEGSFEKGYYVFLANGIFVYLIPPTVGVQMGLFRHHRNIAKEVASGSEKIGMAGSATSSLAMLACCLHHVSDLLPAMGFILATSSLLTEYKDTIIMIGLLASLAGSAYITRAILRNRAIIKEGKSCCPRYGD